MAYTDRLRCLLGTSLAGWLLATFAAAQCGDWSATFSPGLDPIGNPRVTCGAVFDDGTGPALYIGGQFHGVAGVPAERIAKWDGAIWSDVGGGISGGFVTCMKVYDDGQGPALYVGGYFTLAGTLPVARIARWDGTAWSSPGPGVDAGIYTMEVFDDGTGAKLYVGGIFTHVGSTPTLHLAAFNGTNWAEVGHGVDGVVTTLTAYQDVAGPSLFVGGVFMNTAWNLYPAHMINVRTARWDGQQWSSMDQGVQNGAETGAVYSSTVYDDGTGPALYIGGSFNVPFAAFPFEGVAKWDGTYWQPLGSGIPVGITGSTGCVFALRAFDDGTGAKLYAAGRFSSAGGQAAANIARWDGSQWTAIGSGVDAPVDDLVAHDDGSGVQKLYVMGEFTHASGLARNRIARLEGCTPSASFCVGDGSATACPCGNLGAAGHGCANSLLSTGAELRSRGIAGTSTGTDTLMLTATSVSGPGLFLQGTAQAASGTGFAFGDGLLCVGGSLARLGVAFPTAQTVTLPNSFAPTPMHLISGVAAGDVRHYQCWYRDASTFCTVNTFNLTQGLTLTWVP